MSSLILASQSPRRRDLLEKAGFQFQTLSVEISENLNENLSLDEALMDLARRKSEALIRSGKCPNLGEFIVLSADTVVVLDDQVINKPVDTSDAHAILRRLSGKTHIVKTAVCLMKVQFPQALQGALPPHFTVVETSYVTFSSLTDEQIEKYVRECKPMDKAGAYGVQDVPSDFLKEIRGHVDNVMGLPVERVKSLLRESGWDVGTKQS
ncbi:MAG: nucleoside triphosphate pyrophosphatase [Bdellovibrionales bacterium]